MIIYHIGHLGALAKALLIHFNYHQNEKCIIFADEIIFNDDGKIFLRKFAQRAGDFANTIIYSDREFIDENSEQCAETHIKSFFDDLIKRNNVNLNDAEKIYTLFDTFNAFGAYALMNNLPLTFIDAFGMFSRDRYNINATEHWKYYDKVIEKYKALAYGCKADNCKVIYKSSDSEAGKPSIDFNKLKLNLSNKFKKLLLSLYGFEYATDKQPELCNLLVFSSYWICGEKKFSKKDYLYCYQLLLDLFCNSSHTLLLKPHPNALITAQEAAEYFGKSFIIPGYFPSEFIDLLPQYQIDNIMGTSSSGIPTGIYGCKYFISFELFYCEKVCLRLFFAMRLECFLQPDYNKYYHHGMHNKLIWGMQDNKFASHKLHSVWANLNVFEPDSITIIDNYLWNGTADKDKLIKSMENLNNNAVIIFLDSADKKNFIFEGFEHFSNYFITLKFFRVTDGKINRNNIEKIHVFCKDPDTVQTIKNFRYSEYFNYTNQTYKLIQNM